MTGNSASTGSEQSSEHPDKLTIKHRGIPCLFDTSHQISKLWFYPRLEEGIAHEPAVVDVLLEYVESGDVFLDVGGNVGFFSVFMANARPEATVICVEMDPELIPIIKSHRALNGLENLEIVNTAVSDQPGTTVGFSPHTLNNKSQNQMKVSPYGDDGVRVSTMSLDELCDDRNVFPDVIKIDVEGAEGNVIHGMTETMNDHRPTILLEIHPSHLERFDYSPAELLQLIHDENYSLNKVENHRDLDGDTSITPLSELTLAEDTMILAKPENR